MTTKFAGTQTEKNLWAAFAGESQARNKYSYFAGVARKEGFEQIAEIFEETASNERQHAKIWFKHLNGIGNTLAAQFRAVGAIEKAHEERFLKLLKNVQMQQVFAKSEVVMWQCRECGHLCIGKTAPEICPVCAHPQSFQQVRAENY